MTHLMLPVAIIVSVGVGRTMKSLLDCLEVNYSGRVYCGVMLY